MNISNQCESTRKILERDPALDEEWFKRPIPKEAVIPEDQWPDMKFDATQVAIVEDIRRKARNTNETSKLRGYSDEARIRAIEAFYHSPATELTKEEKERLIQLVGYESAPVPLEQPKEGWTFVKKISFYKWEMVLVGSGLLIISGIALKLLFESFH